MNDHVLTKSLRNSLKQSYPRSGKLRRFLGASCITAVLLIPLTSCATSAGQTDGQAEEQSAAASGISTETHSENEGKQWLKDLRRADIIFFGSLPFTYTVSQVGVSLYENIEQGSKLFSSVSFTEELFSKRTLIATVSLSAIFSFADFIIEKSKQDTDD